MPDEENSTAPDEKFNITYKPKLAGGEDVEIPFRLMVVGNFSFKEDDTRLEDRKPTAINKSNFDSVMESKNLELDFGVKDHLSGEEEAQISVKYPVKNMKDLEPDGIVEHIPEMRAQLELSKALKVVRANMADPAKRRDLEQKIAELLSNEERKKKIAGDRKLD